MFKASLDITSKIVTSSLVLFVITIAILENTFLKTNEPFIYLPVLFLLPLLIVTYIYSPKFYSVDMDYIIVHRKVSNFFISRKEIKSTVKISSVEMGMPWRTFGNGGVFGYTGYYSSSKLGKMRWFVSQRKNYVLITMNNDSKYLLSPDDVAGFLAATQS
jgi:hypothetical protein